MKPKFLISEALDADIPELVDLQWRSFSHFELESILAGPNTPENLALSIQRKRKQLETNSGLRIVKVQVQHQNKDKQEQDPRKSRIIGLCMFYLPNEDAPTPEEVTPTPLRPATAWIEAPQIEDPVRRELAEKIMNSSAKQMQSIVKGKSCGYVSYMAVDPQYQRRGVGRMLMEWGTRLFDEHGVDCLLRASDDGVLLYQNFGFESIGVIEIELDRPGAPIRLPVMLRKAHAVGDILTSGKMG